MDGRTGGSCLETSCISIWAALTQGHTEVNEHWTETQVTSHPSEWPRPKSEQTVNAGGATEKRGLACTAGGNANRPATSGNSTEVPQKAKNKSSCDPVSSLLSMYLDKTLLQRSTTPMFIAALFTIAQTRNKLNVHQQVDGWRRRGLYICVYTARWVEYYSAIKKKKILPFAATQMNADITVSEVSQRKTNTIWYHSYVESKKQCKWIHIQNRDRHTDLANELTVTKRERCPGINQESSIKIYKYYYK